MSAGTWFQTGASPAQGALPPATSPPTPVLGVMPPRGPGAGLLAGVQPLRASDASQAAAPSAPPTAPSCHHGDTQGRPCPRPGFPRPLKCRGDVTQGSRGTRAGAAPGGRGGSSSPQGTASHLVSGPPTTVPRIQRLGMTIALTGEAEVSLCRACRSNAPVHT